MRGFTLLATLVLLVGCQSVKTIDRHTLDKLYLDTAMREGTLSIVPLRVDPSQPAPTVVNWWYAGSRDNEHTLVYRELTWDSVGNPVGKEQRYRIAKSALAIGQPFARTKNAAQWLALYEAAQGFKPPADLPTSRQAPTPLLSEPVRLPEVPVLPQAD